MWIRVNVIFAILFLLFADAAQKQTHHSKEVSGAHLRRNARYTTLVGRGNSRYYPYNVVPFSPRARSFLINRQTFGPDSNPPANDARTGYTSSRYRSYRKFGRGKQNRLKQSITTAIRRYEKNQNKSELARRIERILSSGVNARLHGLRSFVNKELQKSEAQSNRIWAGISESKTGISKLHNTCLRIASNVSTLSVLVGRHKKQSSLHAKNIQQKIEQIEDHQNTQDQRFFEVVGKTMNNTRRVTRLQNNIQQEIQNLHMEKESLTQSLHRIQNRLQMLYREEVNKQNKIIAEMQTKLFSHSDLMLAHGHSITLNQNSISRLNTTCRQQQRVLARLQRTVERIGLEGENSGQSLYRLLAEARTRLENLSDLQNLIVRLNQSLQHAVYKERRLETRMVILERNLQKIAKHVNLQRKNKSTADTLHENYVMVDVEPDLNGTEQKTAKSVLDQEEEFSLTRLSPSSKEVIAAIAETGIQDRLDRMSRSLQKQNLHLNNVTQSLTSVTEDVKSLSMTTANYFEIINKQARDIRKQNETINYLKKKFEQHENMFYAFFDYQRERMMTIVSGLVKQMEKPIKENRDCHDLWVNGKRQSGVYTIIKNMETWPIYCNMTSVGGWTVIQRRWDGTQDFNKGVKDYEKGFGSVFGEFWLGLDTIRWLTHARIYTLKVIIEDWVGNQRQASYDRFVVYGQDYKLRVSGYTGNAGDSMMESNDLPFNARHHSRETTITSTSDCTSTRQAGWWFPQNCGEANPNGPYPGDPREAAKPYMESQGYNVFNGLEWMKWRSAYYPLKKVSMQIIPHDVLANAQREGEESGKSQGGKSTTKATPDVPQHREPRGSGERRPTYDSDTIRQILNLIYNGNNHNNNNNNS